MRLRLQLAADPPHLLTYTLQAVVVFVYRYNFEEDPLPLDSLYNFFIVVLLLPGPMWANQLSYWLLSGLPYTFTVVRDLSSTIDKT